MFVVWIAKQLWGEKGKKSRTEQKTLQSAGCADSNANHLTAVGEEVYDLKAKRIGEPLLPLYRVQ